MVFQFEILKSDGLTKTLENVSNLCSLDPVSRCHCYVINSTNIMRHTNRLYSIYCWSVLQTHITIHVTTRCFHQETLAVKLQMCFFPQSQLANSMHEFLITSVPDINWQSIKIKNVHQCLVSREKIWQYQVVSITSKIL